MYINTLDVYSIFIFVVISVTKRDNYKQKLRLPLVSACGMAKRTRNNRTKFQVKKSEKFSKFPRLGGIKTV